MPKSASKAVSTPAAVALPTDSTKNGKRDAEKAVEEEVADIKKQKIANGDVAGDIGKKKKTRKKKNKKQEVEKKEELNNAVTATNEVCSNNEKSESGDGAPEAKAAKAEDANDNDEPKKNATHAEMVDAPSAEKPDTVASESKTLFMGNLSFSVEESHIVDFFKDVGEVVEVRFAMRDDRFAGYGHVDFATPDVAQKALKLNGELLLERAVRLDLAKERSPPSGEKPSQKSGLTVFVRGFGTEDGFDSVRSSLEEHFGQCGEITRMAIPKDFESGCPKGVAFIDFSDSSAFNKALELGGSEVSGGTITVEEAKQRGGDGGSGRGRGGGRGGRGGGRGRWGSRGHGGGRGRGRGRGRH